MTQFHPLTIQCKCKNLVKLNFYESVNVTVNPSLQKKVEERKINSYECSKCGVKKELVCQFLYVDMKKKIWVWCYPEDEKANKGEIEDELIFSQSHLYNFLEKLSNVKPKLVFGYDELLAIIN